MGVGSEKTQGWRGRDRHEKERISLCVMSPAILCGSQLSPLLL